MGVFHAFKISAVKLDSTIGYNIDAHLSFVTSNVSRALKYDSCLLHNDVRENFPFYRTDIINFNNSLAHTSTKRSSRPKRVYSCGIVNNSCRKTICNFSRFRSSDCCLSQTLKFIFWHNILISMNLFKSTPERQPFNWRNFKLSNVNFSLELLVLLKSEMYSPWICPCYCFLLILIEYLIPAFLFPNSWFNISFSNP